MVVSLAQISPKLSQDNFQKHFENIEKSIGKADVIVFPELSMNGYLLKDSVYEDAFDLEELKEFREKSKKIDIILGVALKVKHKIYNSSIYFSGGKVLHIHHKNHLPNYGMFQESRFYFAGESVEMFENRGSKIITVICEDLWSSEVVDIIASQKPDIVYVLANSPSRGFFKSGLEIENKWETFLKTTAMLSGAYVVFCNRTGFEDGLGFWGGSRIIEPNGKVVNIAKKFKEDLIFTKLNHQISFTQKYLLRIE